MPLKTAIAQQTNKPVDEVRVLIDISGSMKRTDPNNLRSPALRLFVSLLPTGTNAGVWTFGQWVNMLIKPAPVDNQWKLASQSATERINSHGKFTNIEGVLQESTWDWSRPLPGSRRSLILLTDGLVDISSNSDENSRSRNRILDEILPRLSSAGVKINTIALSHESDSELLHQLSATTGGWFETIDSADGLEKLFLRIFEKVASANTLPLDNNRVSIDSSIKEATFLIFRGSGDSPTSLTSPSAKSFSLKDHPKEIQWHEESRYDLITIANPEPGDWQINAELDPDNRVMVVTDLQLQNTILPNDLAAEKDINFQVNLVQEGKIIQRSEFLQFVKIRLTQTSMKEEKWSWDLLDDGLPPDTAANDGIFSTRLRESIIQGEHEFEVTVDGTTFKRNTRQLIKVYDKPVSIHTSHPSDDRITISIVPYQTLINADSMVIKATHINPSGEKNNIEVPRISPSEWILSLESLPSGGKQSVLLRIIGSNPDGEEIDTLIPPIDFEIGSTADSRPPVSDVSNSVDIQNDVSNLSVAVNWTFVTLRVLVFNILLGSFIFTGIKLWPKLKRILVPLPIEALKNA